MEQQLITRMVRKVSKHGTSIGVTLPTEFGFNAGEYVIWAITDNGSITLSKIDIIGGVPQYTVIDRKHRKSDLYEHIKNVGELVKENFLLARFAIEHGISLNVLHTYRDELFADGLIHRIGDTLQAI